MRIQARLFMGTALLVLSLTGVQWWLHQRQLRAMQRELATVAVSVGEHLLTGEERRVLIRNLVPGPLPGLLTTGGNPDCTAGIPGDTRHHLIPAPPGDPRHNEQHRMRTIEMVIMTGEGEVDLEVEESEETELPTRAPTPCMPVIKVGVAGSGPRKVERYTWQGTIPAPKAGPQQLRDLVVKGELQQLHELKFEVIDGADTEEQYLVVTGEGNFEERVPIPVSTTSKILQSSLRQGIAVSAALLLIGLVASGLLSRQLARPMQSLADGVDTLGRGDLGVQVPVTATGEVGELQQAFNRMSLRLAELETEREGWRRREHLVQLGDLARGLAHTVRNPLNTLGLTVEELAGGQVGGDRLVITARAQIRRIDRWLRSFLALGAGDAATSEETDLAELTQSVVLELIQQGAPVRLELPEQPLMVRVVPTALRAALANLLENAVQASPRDADVAVTVRGDSERAEVTLHDQGPGLPSEVRQRLFAPHVTTKVGGSGMGLFLARQLVVSMHGGTLEVEDAPQGGTVVTVALSRVIEGGA